MAMPNSHNPDDAAGEFKYALNTLYFQDKFELSGYDVTITAGLRYDWYTSDDKPTHNQNFEDRYGYSNAQNLDGVDLVQPRFGFNWTATDQLEVRGGFRLGILAVTQMFGYQKQFIPNDWCCVIIQDVS